MKNFYRIYRDVRACSVYQRVVTGSSFTENTDEFYKKA